MWYGTGVSSWSLSRLSTKPPCVWPCSFFSAAILATKSIVAFPPGTQVQVGGLIVMPSHLIVVAPESSQLPLLLPVTLVIVTPGPALHQKLLMKPTSLTFWTRSV